MRWRAPPVLRARSTVAAAVVVAGLASGCAETKASARESLRYGPLRGRALAASSVDESPVMIRAAEDALTDTELSRLETDVSADFARTVRGQTGEPIEGLARLHSCRLEAGVGRAHTVYNASCIAVLEVGGEPVVRVEARAERQVRTRAITSDDVEALKKNPRHPALLEQDARAVLLEASAHAARLLLDPAYRTGNDDEATPVSPTVDVRRARARARDDVASSKPARRAAGATDLARYGDADDATLLLKLLEDEDVRVRRAAAMAMGELGAESAGPPLVRLLDDEDALVQRAAEDALRRLCAFYPDDGVGASSAQPDERPSNSSTPGAAEAGLIPAAARNDSTWRQNAACSKR